MGLPLGLLVGEFYYRADALPVPDTQPALQCQRTTSINTDSITRLSKKLSKQ